MNYEFLQLSPQASARGNSMRIAIHGPWSAPSGSSRDIQFLRSWLEFDSDSSGRTPRGRFNWGAVAGAALVIGISASFWTGIGLMISRFAH
jgi:hypothetical protein